MLQAFPTCIDLMMQVHDLIDVGLGDSTEVDAIQDEMDGLWKNLSEEEMCWIRYYSASLYSLVGLR